MTNNRKIANSVFNELRREGLIPINVQFSNGYFRDLVAEYKAEKEGII